MNMLKIISVTAVFALLLTVPVGVFAQQDDEGFVQAVSDDVSIRIGGTFQPRVTYASDLNAVGDRYDRVGFGIRRLRLRVTANFGERLGVFFQMEGAGATLIWQDLRGDIRLDDHLTLRVGRFVGAQPRAYARTSHAYIDAIDRPAISDMWARMTIGGDGRDYGVEALWNTPKWELRGFLHNGYNRWNYSTGISRDPATGGIETEGFAVSAAATHWPDGRDRLEVGAYASVSTAKNELTQIANIGRNYVAYSAHAYWGPMAGDQPFRLKTDIIGISYQEVAPWDVENYIGASLFSGILVAPHIELFAMGEYWHGDGGGQNGTNQVFATIGGTYSLSALLGRPFVHNRIMLAYSIRSMEADTIDLDEPAHVVMMQMQFYF